MKQKPNDQTKQSGIEAVAEMLGLMEKEDRERILKNISEQDPGLVKKIKDQIFCFDHLSKLSTKDMQILMKEIPFSKWALALRGASDQMKQAVFASISSRKKEMLQEEIDILGKQLQSVVHAVQLEIVEKAIELNEAKKINIFEKVTE